MTVTPVAADAERLQRRLRWPALSRSAEPDVRVALLSTFTVDPLVPYLGTELAGEGIRADLWVAPFNQIERQCLEAESATAQFAPHIAVCVPRLEELWSGKDLPLAADPAGYGEDLRYLAQACVDAASRWDADLVFVLPPVPETRPAGVGDDGNDSGVLAAASAARESVRGLLAGRSRVHVVDAEAVLRTIGSRGAYRPALLAAARIPYSEEYFDLLGRRISRLIALPRRGGGTLLALDADDLVEDLGTDEPQRPAAAGDRARVSPETSFTAYLGELARTGVVIGVCNAAPELRARLETGLPGALWQTASADRAQDLRDLAAAAGVGLDRVVFVGSPKSALEQVRAEHPEVAVVELPPEREAWVGVLNADQAVDRLPPARRAEVADPAIGSDDAAPTLEGFLKSLRLSVGFVPLSELTAHPAEDLTRAVSEFHLDGEVWPADRFTSQAPGTVCLGVTVNDRFGDHGMCGVVVARPDGPVLSVDLWALTCPVLGKGVEDRILDRLMELAAEQQCTTVAFAYRPTPRNEVVRAYLAALSSGSATAPLDPGPVLVPVGRRATGPSSAVPPSVEPSVELSVEPSAAPRPARRSAPRSPASGRLTNAAQILRAVEAGRPRVRRVPAGEVTPPRTDMERRLLAVFQEVLRVPDIGVEANFFALGDSMLAVQLVARANRAGVRVALRQLFRHQTVAELAAVATEARRDETAVAVTSAPLLPLQSWFFGLGLADPGHFNQSQRFELPVDVDVDAVRLAVAALVERHTSLRVRFADTPTGIQQIDPGPPAEPPFGHIDLGDLDPGQWERALQTHELDLHRAMNPAEGRLAAFAVFTFAGRRPPRLLVIFHHLAIDGITWRILLGDLQEGYRQALLGPVALAPESFPVLAWARRLHEYAQSEPVRAELPRWLAVRDAETVPLPADVPGAHADGAITDEETAVFSAEETAALREAAVGEYGSSLDILLLAAAVRVLTRWTGGPRLLVDVVNHGREAFVGGVDLSRTAGWLVLNVPMLFDAGGSGELAELVPGVRDAVQAFSSDHGAGDNLLRFLSDDESVRRQLAALPAAEVLFSYNGDVDSGHADGPLLGASVPGTVPDIAQGATSPYSLMVQSMIVGGRIHFEIGYRATQFHPSTMRRLAAEWTSELRGLIGRSDPSGTSCRSES